MLTSDLEFSLYFYTNWFPLSCFPECSSSSQPCNGQHAPQRWHARRTHAPWFLSGKHSWFHSLPRLLFHSSPCHACASLIHSSIHLFILSLSVHVGGLTAAWISAIKSFQSLLFFHTGKKVLHHPMVRWRFRELNVSGN